MSTYLSGRTTYRVPGRNVDRGRARLILPEAVAMLGEPGQMVLVHPETGDFYVFRPAAGSILVAAPGGREMFILRPLADAGKPRKLDQLLHVEELYERFAHRLADSFYNCFVAPMRQPVLRGWIQTLRYRSDKAVDDEYDDGQDADQGPIEYEHAFEAPDYAELFAVGAGQFYIPRGPWRLTEAGIVHHRDH